MLSERTSRRLFVALAMLAAAVALWQSLSIPPAQFEPVGGARVPQVAGALTLLLGLLFVARTLATGGLPAATPPAIDRRGIIFVALFAGAAIALGTGLGGFAVIGSLFLVATQALYRTSRAGWIVPAICLALAAIALELLFTRVFVIDLPRTF
ncbi:MAG: hypothetical protein AcusKO_12780 [Acuticoccus sp.]